MKGRVSLAEIMGKKGSSLGDDLSLSDLPALLGDALPEMPYNAVGKHRLINALRNRFGSGFRNIPGVKSIIKDFDDTVSFENRVAQLREVKAPKKKGS